LIYANDFSYENVLSVDAIVALLWCEKWIIKVKKNIL
jgi:hypothetical protein